MEGNSWSKEVERVQKEALKVEEEAEAGHKDMSPEIGRGHLQGRAKGVGGN